MGATTTVQTSEGSYRGTWHSGVAAFRGMRYGRSTAGANRFRPPRPPEPWSGERDAFDYGDQSPQMASFLAGPEKMSEDCLRINVWAPAESATATDSRIQGKRPVMVWFHGGGFEAGSGSSGVYDGSFLATKGDVVVATINHRLNVFGHCYLDGVLGEDFAQSGNVGYLDLIAALEWVRANIAAFGGDPDQVTIFGQSGGGRKVSLCFAGKQADGLFSRGIVQSGSHVALQDRETASELTRSLLAELQIPATQAAKLQDVPIDVLTAAQNKVAPNIRTRFSPVLDGDCFTEHPFHPEAPGVSRHVPMMLGTTRTELAAQLGRRPGLYEMGEEEAKKAAARFIPEADVDEAFGVFQACSPEAPPPEVFLNIATARGYWLDAMLMAQARARLPESAETYLYRLTWRSPINQGRAGSPHMLDLPFMFGNTAAMPFLTGPETEETAALAATMTDAWLRFAKTGQPAGLDDSGWRPFDLERRTTMLFDVPPKVADDPFRAEREFMSRYPSQLLG